MKAQLLIIDDDQDLVLLIKKYAEDAGYTVQTAYTGAEGLMKIATGNYQLIILDVMLPVIDGFNVLAELRKSHHMPVLMLTAKGLEDDKIKGLTMGADDYLTKPFSINELMARVASLLRRYTTMGGAAPVENETIQIKNLSIDCHSRTVTVSGKEIDLTAKEFDMLKFLASHPGKIFTKKQLYNHVWEEEYNFDDSNIMSFISKLRKKIELNPAQPHFIQTVRGVGYRFNGER